MAWWELDDTSPVISPDRMLAYYGGLVSDNDLALPDTLVATFQVRVLDHLARRVGNETPERWPTPVLWPLARGVYRGKALAVARLPIGAPAAAMALELMIAAGVRDILLVGSAGSLQPELEVGSLVIPSTALRYEGTSHHYLPPERPATASGDLVDGLASAALRRGFPAPAVGTTWTTDAPYRECRETVRRLRQAGVLVVEMEAAAVFAIANHRGARAALIAAVSDELSDPWSPAFHTPRFQRALLRAADVALDATALLPPILPSR